MQHSIQSPVVSGPGVHVCQYSPGRGWPFRAWVVGDCAGSLPLPQRRPLACPTPCSGLLVRSSSLSHGDPRVTEDLLRGTQ